MHSFCRTFKFALCFIVPISGCIGIKPIENIPEVKSQERTQEVTDSFKRAPARRSNVFAGAKTIKKLSSINTGEYRTGPGDVMDITVWNRKEVSRKGIVVAPDGVISLPRIGLINIKGKTLQEVTQLISLKLSIKYEDPEVSIQVRDYKNNKAFVLGRVTKPGVIHFPGDGTLLEALALAGGLPYIGKETFLTKCAVIRGKATIMWIDLRELLDHGNMSLNARIINNDVIFIPEA